MKTVSYKLLGLMHQNLVHYTWYKKQFLIINESVRCEREKR